MHELQKYQTLFDEGHMCSLFNMFFFNAFEISTEILGLQQPVRRRGKKKKGKGEGKKTEKEKSMEEGKGKKVKAIELKKMVAMEFL